MLDFCVNTHFSAVKSVFIICSCEVTTIRFQFFTSNTTAETKTMVRSGYALVTAVLYPGLQSK